MVVGSRRRSSQWIAHPSRAGLTCWQQVRLRRPNNYGGMFPCDWRSLHGRKSTCRRADVTTRAMRRTARFTVSVAAWRMAAWRPKTAMLSGVCWPSLPPERSRPSGDLRIVRSAGEGRNAENPDSALRASTRPKTTSSAPDVLAEVSESCDRLLNAIPDETMKTIVLLKFQGATNGEIADEMKCTRRTVERKLERIRRIWVEAGLHDSEQ
jgi:hypothetical protein